MRRLLLLTISAASLACAQQGIIRPSSVIVATPAAPLVSPASGSIGLYSSGAALDIVGSPTVSGIISLTPGAGTSPREVRISSGTANETLDLNLAAGDDVDDLVRIGLFNAARTDGWRIVFDQGAVSDVFRIQDHLANDALIIDQTNLNTSFRTLANITNDVSLVAGDNVDDLVRLRLLNLAGTDGWQLLFDQGTVSDVFRIQDNVGNTALVIDQTNLDTSLQTLPNVLNSFGLIAGDAVDDDVRILMESSTGSNGYQFFWDQSVDDLRIELHDGTALMTLNSAGITLHVPCAGCGDTHPVVDTISIVEGSSNPANEIRFEVDGVTGTRVLTPQDANYTLAGTNLVQSFTSDQTFTTGVTVNSTFTFSGSGLDYELDRSASEGFIISRQGGDNIIEVEEISSTLNEMRLQAGSGASDDVLLRLVNSTAGNGFQMRWDQSVDVWAFELHDGTSLADWDANILIMNTGFALDSNALASLGTPIDGTIEYCNDCLKGSDPCTASSSGALAVRVNSAWQCP